MLETVPQAAHKTGLSAEERTLRARLAAHRLHATHDSRELTKNARASFMARFEKEVDPEGLLSPEERQKRASHAHKAHMLKLAFASVRARRLKAEGR